MTKTCVYKRKPYGSLRSWYQYTADSQKADSLGNIEKAPCLKGNYGKNACLHEGAWPQKDASN